MYASTAWMDVIISQDTSQIEENIVYNFGKEGGLKTAKDNYYKRWKILLMDKYSYQQMDYQVLPAG